MIWLIWLAIAAAWALASRLFIRGVPVRYPWTGFLGVVVAGFVMGLITRPPRTDWEHLHSFESALGNHVIPPTVGFFAVFAVILGFKKNHLSDAFWVGIGAVLFCVVAAATSVAMLIACCY